MTKRFYQPDDGDPFHNELCRMSHEMAGHVPDRLIAKLLRFGRLLLGDIIGDEDGSEDGAPDAFWNTPGDAFSAREYRLLKHWLESFGDKIEEEASAEAKAAYRDLCRAVDAKVRANTEKRAA